MHADRKKFYIILKSYYFLGQVNFKISLTLLWLILDQYLSQRTHCQALPVEWRAFFMQSDVHHTDK
jgi:hypothetical protein